MPAVGLLFALLVLLAIAGTVGLWYAIDHETDDASRMSRTDAERAARQDIDGDREGIERDAADGDGCGTDTEWGVDDDRR